MEAMKRCGTAYMYKLGCRCSTCVAGESARQKLAADRKRRRAAGEMPPLVRRKERPIAVVHGRIGTYSFHKCRCDQCRAAWRVYIAERRAREREERRAA
jgi:hypothetical protein